MYHWENLINFSCIYNNTEKEAKQKKGGLKKQGSRRLFMIRTTSRDRKSIQSDDDEQEEDEAEEIEEDMDTEEKDEKTES